MIGSLRGTFLERWDDGSVLVEVSGVGYRVTVTPATAAAMGEPGSDVFAYVFHHVREDAETLFGFVGRDERICFEALLSAHGVGPSLALAILAVHTPTKLQQILLDEDLDSLCLVPGVGKKTASRLLIELKSKLDILELGDAVTSVTGLARRDGDASSALSDVRDALANLGYGNDEILAVVRDLPDGGDPSRLLREALQRLAVS